MNLLSGALADSFQLLCLLSRGHLLGRKQSSCNFFVPSPLELLALLEFEIGKLGEERGDFNIFSGCGSRGFGLGCLRFFRFSFGFLLGRA